MCLHPGDSKINYQHLNIHKLNTITINIAINFDEMKEREREREKQRERERELEREREIYESTMNQMNELSKIRSLGCERVTALLSTTNYCHEFP